MNRLIQEADNLLKNGVFEYAVCGGYAIEMFLNNFIRRHGDIDIAVFWDERDKIILFMQSLGWRVYELCGDGMAHHITDVAHQFKIRRNIFCVTDECEIVSLTPADERDMFLVSFDNKGQNKLNFIEFLFNDKNNDSFLYARNHDVLLPLSKAILNRDGINYLAPEMVLLYKSTDTEREGYQLDYEQAMNAMTAEQKKWLREALQLMNPNGHKWVNNNDIMSFDNFLTFRDVKIRNKDHERIVRMFYPYFWSVCGVQDALSKVIGKIIGVDFSETTIMTGCFNGIGDGGSAPFGIPALYCKWENGIRVYVYGTFPECSRITLNKNEYVLFVLSDSITSNIQRNPDGYVYMRNR